MQGRRVRWLVLASALCAPAVSPAHGQPSSYSAPEASVAAVAGLVAQNAGACAAVWPGYWHPGKPFGFSRRADSTIYVYLPGEAPPAPYAAVRGAAIPRQITGLLYARRGYPDGFGGVDIVFRAGAATLPVVPAYAPHEWAVLDLLYHEGFHAYQWETFTAVPGARAAFGSTLAPVSLDGTPEEFEALAEAERQALAAALVAPSLDSVRVVLREYLSTRARRAGLAPDAQRVEQWEEQMEGTAQYVGEMCSAYAMGAGSERVRARIGAQLAEPQPALLAGRPSKWRAYAVGAALALLLDDLGAPDWRRVVAAGTALDVYLRQLLREQ